MKSRPRIVTTKTPQGPRRTGALPRYVSIGNAKRVAYSVDVADVVEELGRGIVTLDFDAGRKLIGVKIG